MEYQALIGDCDRCQAGLEQLSQNLINQLEAMLVILEEGIQLLSSSTYGTEFSILEEMWKNLVHYLRLMIYGFNDTTIPPVKAIDHKTQVMNKVFPHFFKNRKFSSISR